MAKVEDIRGKEFVTRDDLQIYYGFSLYQAKKIVHDKKLKLVKKGVLHYANAKVNYIPHAWLRKELGLDIGKDENNNEK